MAIKKLDESRLIELAQFIAFMEVDEDFLDELLDEAGVGHEGDYERYRLEQAKWHLGNSRQYLEMIVDTWLARDDSEIIDPKLKDIPVTFVGDQSLVTVKKDKQTTTFVDNKIRIVDIPTPKSRPPWKPAFKDEDKIAATIKEIIAETTVEERKRDGFQGWLAGSATAALGGKTDPKLMLKKIREVLV